MKKIKATYIGRADNRWEFIPNQVHHLSVYSRGSDRVWVTITNALTTQSPASYPDIMDFLTNWDHIETQV